jgi:hypothetical protein
MVTADEVAGDDARLANLEVEFPRLDADRRAACAMPLRDLLAYLADEVPDGGHPDPAEEFSPRAARTAGPR